jgi:hypothetical protein
VPRLQILGEKFSPYVLREIARVGVLRCHSNRNKGALSTARDFADKAYERFFLDCEYLNARAKEEFGRRLAPTELDRLFFELGLR